MIRLNKRQLVLGLAFLGFATVCRAEGPRDHYVYKLSFVGARAHSSSVDLGTDYSKDFRSLMTVEAQVSKPMAADSLSSNREGPFKLQSRELYESNGSVVIRESILPSWKLVKTDAKINEVEIDENRNTNFIIFLKIDGVSVGESKRPISMSKRVSIKNEEFDREDTAEIVVQGMDFDVKLVLKRGI